MLWKVTLVIIYVIDRGPGNNFWPLTMRTTIMLLCFFEVVQQGYLVGLIWGLRLWGSELSGRGSRARWVRAALSDHIINDTHDGICDIYVISSNMAIYGKPGQHCIGSRESAQESCSEMPDAKIIMRRRGCSGCWRDIKWMYNEHISKPTQPSIITVDQMPKENFS